MALSSRQTTTHQVSDIEISCACIYPYTGRALDLDLNVHGAPNFRAPRQGDLNVFGAAQPRTQGLRAILSVLRSRPNALNPSHVVWFSTREEPIGAFSILYLGILPPTMRLDIAGPYLAS